MVRVRVIPNKPNTLGSKIVYISTELANKYEFVEDMIIELTGPVKRSAAIVKYFDEEPLIELPDESVEGFIAVDSLLRSSIGCSIDSIIRIDRTTVKKGEKLVLAPLDHTDMEIQNGLLSEDLLNQLPVVEYDIVTMKSLQAVNTATTQQSERFAHTNLGEIRFVVIETTPKGIIRVDENTEISIRKSVPEDLPPNIKSSTLTYDDIGGMNDAKTRLHELVEIPLKNPKMFQTINVEFPKGVLISGISGIGKSLLAEAIANATEAYIIHIDPGTIINPDVKEAEKLLTKLFREAIVKAPSLIVMENIQDLAPLKSSQQFVSDAVKRVNAQLIKEIDAIPSNLPVQIIATAQNASEVDMSLRRPGRLDAEILLKPPDTLERLEILEIKTRGTPISDAVDLSEFAHRTKGYTGADLASLVKEAALSAFRKILPSINVEESIPKHILQTLKMSSNDFEEALKRIDPSATKEIFADIPDVNWQQIGGLEKVKQELKEACEWPLSKPEVFRKMGIRPPTGVLLYGPPGTGKTLLAKAVANVSQANFLPIRGPELLSKWLGESEAKVRDIFRLAREISPTIIFIDEIDSLVRRRGASPNESYMDRIINQFLVEMDGVDRKAQILIIGATNRPELLDPAIMRPGRFDRLIYIPSPDKQTREAILKVHTKNMPIAPSVNLETIAMKTEYYTGADLENLCKEAAILALRENITAEIIENNHFEMAIESSSPTMSQELNDYFETISKSLRGKATSKIQRNLSDSYA